MFQNLIELINQFLSPVEKILNQYKKYIGYFILLLAAGTIFFLGHSSMEKFTGEQALNVLWIILFLPIVSKVLGIKLAQSLMPMRKELGILMGMLALVHSIQYFLPSGSYIPSFVLLWYVDFWIYDGLPTSLGIGVIAFVLTFFLLLTSNRISVNFLGKNWKRLHQIVYLIVILTITHKVLYRFEGSGMMDYGEFASLVFYFTGKILEWKGVSLYKKSYQKGQKWLCPPCGYIYDPIIGDADSGIAPGTEFADIPDNWRCPVCGVAKADFIPYEEGKEEVKIEATVQKLEYLNPTTIELTITTPVVVSSEAGQFVTFIWTDEQGEFSRSYSIATSSLNSFTFLIKLGELGRWASLLRKLAIGDTVAIRWVFGHFVLQDTAKPKIFIATGTGLAPIYNMIHAVPTGVKKVLYFTISTAAELFYVEKLRAIPNLELHIHTTKEEVAGCEFCRVNIDEIIAENGTEWYLCGNPRMVTEAKEKLATRWFESVYSEEF